MIYNTRNIQKAVDGFKVVENGNGVFYGTLEECKRYVDTQFYGDVFGIYELNELIGLTINHISMSHYRNIIQIRIEEKEIKVAPPHVRVKIVEVKGKISRLIGCEICNAKVYIHKKLNGVMFFRYIIGSYDSKIEIIYKSI